MKTKLTLALLLVCSYTFGQHSLERLWETDTTLAVPESVLFTPGAIYVTLIDGSPWDLDGKGEIGKIDKSGKILNAAWSTGLNAPKGMAMWKDKLYVADVTTVAVINSSGKIESRIPVEGAQGLNDVCADDKGTIYVTDSKLGNVHQIKNGQATLFLSDMKGVNGVTAIGTDVYILTAAGVQKAGPDKKVTLVAPMEIGGDGIEPVGNGDYLVSCWAGLIYYLGKDGSMEKLLDTRDQKKSSADIGFDPATRTVFVPTFFKKSVVAYKLK